MVRGESGYGFRRRRSGRPLLDRKYHALYLSRSRIRRSRRDQRRREETMKWITRERVKVDRVACPWLIKHFVDKDAEFVFVPPDKVMDEAKRLDAIPYIKNVELGHHGKECSFEAILKKYKLTADRALVLLGKIVNGADTDNALYQQPEGPGLEAIAEGFRHLAYKDDHAPSAADSSVFDPPTPLPTNALAPSTPPPLF